MAILTDEQKTPIRRAVVFEEKSDTGTGAKHTRPQINTAIQEIEDHIAANPHGLNKFQAEAWLLYQRNDGAATDTYYETHKTAIGSAIETALPGVFSNTEKKRVFRGWVATQVT